MPAGLLRHCQGPLRLGRSRRLSGWMTWSAQPVPAMAGCDVRSYRNEITPVPAWLAHDPARMEDRMTTIPKSAEAALLEGNAEIDTRLARIAAASDNNGGQAIVGTGTPCPATIER